MYTLLGLTKQVEMPHLVTNRWHELAKQLKQNLQLVMKYYRHMDRYVPSSHLLDRLLTLNPVSTDLDLRTFYANVDSRALRLAQQVGLTTIRQVGGNVDPTFYSKDIKEIIIGHNDEFDYVAADKNWQDLEPVKILYHPRTDLSFYPLDGSEVSGEDGYAVIAINISMLLIQWRAYRNYMVKYYREHGLEGVNRGHFIFKHPLLNALKSHMDITIINRMYHRLHMQTAAMSGKRHPFALTDWSSKLNQYQDEQIKLIQERSYDLDSVMFNIPLLSSTSMQDCAKLPSLVPSRQILWALVLSRVRFIRMVLEMSSDRALERDTKELAMIKRKINQYRNDHLFGSVLPLWMQQNLQMDFDAILKYT